MIHRAERFPMRIPLKYRAVGAREWRDGTTANISASGVLFSAESMLQQGIRLELTLVFPGQVSSQYGRVICYGNVVRVQQPSTDEPAAMAATIRKYRLIKGDMTTHG